MSTMRPTGPLAAVSRHLQGFSRRLYRGGRPGRLARTMNRMAAAQYAAGFLAPRRAVTLEVRGRQTGRTVSFPLVLVEAEGDRYLVSMLGREVNWIRNVRADGGRATLRRGGREAVRLEEVEDAALRARVLRRYLQLAPGARPHIAVDRHASLAEFEQVGDRYPVFRLVPAGPRA